MNIDFVLITKCIIELVESLQANPFGAIILFGIVIYGLHLSGSASKYKKN